MSTPKDKFPKLHKVQWKILNKMKYSEFSRFNQLKLKDMDPKRFTYHLKRLRKMGLVDHNVEKGNYFLTDKGKLLVDYFKKIPSFEDFPIDPYILLYIEKGDELLVVQRKRAPFLDFVGVPSCDTQKDNFIHESAKNKLSSLGLKGELLMPLIIEVLYKSQDGKVRNHACMFIFFIKDPKGTTIKEDDEGRLFWMTPKDLLKVEKGYDNSSDLVDFFENKKFRKDRVKMISRTYHNPW